MSESTRKDEVVWAAAHGGGAHAGGIPPRAVMRNYLSSHLLWMALHAAEMANRIEAHAGRSVFDIEHRAHVLSAIIGSAAFLEGAINELFQDAAEKRGITDDGYLAPLKADTVDAMANCWQDAKGLRGMSVLGKWDLLLVCGSKQPLERGAAAYQNARLAVGLRNAVVHYRPEDVSAELTHDTETSLRGKFAPNRLVAEAESPWWPDQCLGHSCAAWTTDTVVTFADRVTDELGLRPNYRRVAEGGWFERLPGSSSASHR